jgi:ribosomal protein S10
MKKTKSEILLKSHNKSVLFLFSLFIKKILIKNNIFFNVVSFPIKKKLFTFNKSPHVYKKAQEHFELLIFKTMFTNIDHSLINLINYTKINKPKGLRISFRTYTSRRIV